MQLPIHAGIQVNVCNEMGPSSQYKSLICMQSFAQISTYIEIYFRSLFKSKLPCEVLVEF